MNFVFTYCLPRQMRLVDGLAENSDNEDIEDERWTSISTAMTCWRPPAPMSAVVGLKAVEEEERRRKPGRSGEPSRTGAGASCPNPAL